MSGQPVRTPADGNKYRNQYLETLQLQDSINDMNLQANKNYLLTGQLPPQSQMQDTRTNAEKLRDIEGLKQNIVSQLSPVYEPQFSYQIVNKVMSSPLNLNNSLIRFLAQRASSIVEQLRKIYPYGVSGDDNDLEKIVEFIKNMYSEQQGKFQSTKTFMSSQGSQGTSNRILAVNDFDAIITNLEDIIKNISLLTQKNVNKGGIAGTRGICREIMSSLIRLKEVLPTTNQLRLMLDDIENPQYKGDFPPTEEEENEGNIFRIPFEYSREDMEALFDLLEKLPKYTEVMALVNKIKQYLNTGNFDLFKQGLENLKSLILGVDNIRNRTILDKFHKIKVRQSYKEDQYKQYEAVQTRQNIIMQDKRQRDISKAQKVYVINPQEDPVYVSNSVAQQLNQTDNQQQNNDNQQQNNDNQAPNQAIVNSQGLGIGKGRRGRPRGSGLPKTIPMPKPPNFIGFGINEINQKQLDKGLLKIRRNTKSNFLDMPTRRVSKNLQGIIKTIVGGGVPKYEELGKLDNDEKEYLHKIVSRSNLEDKLSVPAPSKDQQEKDIHNFEVMKGQIMAGNDSQELVKKFKLLVRKLSKQGLLPKADVEDILDTLSDLGY